MDKDIIVNDIARRPASQRSGRSVCRGTRYFTDDQLGWQAWVMFHEPLDELTALERSGFYPARWGGPGQPFLRHPDVWSTKRRTLVTQDGGWDI